MAYRWNGTSDFVEFAIAPLVGSLDAFTIATFYTRASVGVASRDIVSFNGSALGSTFRDFRIATDNKPYWWDSANFPNGTQVMNSTTTWYLLAVTKAAGSGVTPRFHVHDGSSWVHAAGSAAVNPWTIVSGDRLRVGVARATSNFFNGDMVCVGIKKTDSADATVETLSRTAWSAWTGFGFDWLIGFDSSLESAGILQDQAAPGTGDEVSISGTTAVADPAGWSWSATPPSTFVPRVISVT